jgi:hypothetical protein
MVDAADLLFSDLPQHEMTFDAADAVKRRVSKLMLFAALTAQANEAIRKTGLDPAGFIVDEFMEMGENTKCPFSCSFYVHKPE